MNPIGVFARAFAVGSPYDVAEAVADSGFSTVQLNLSVLGRPTLDSGLERGEAVEIRDVFRTHGVSIWGVSGTFNAVHPDVATRRRETSACAKFIGRGEPLEATAVTLCTGTRDARDMWKGHPDNESDSAWRDLRETLDVLIPAAEAAGVLLGIEPEGGNVVRDAAHAARLIREVGDGARYLTVVLDPANLLTMETLHHQDRVLQEAFDLLEPSIGCVHAKDVVPDGSYGAPGMGGLDFDLLMRCCGALAETVPIIAQDLTADDAPRVHQFLTDALSRNGR